MATRQACHEAKRYASAITGLNTRWQRQIGRMRRVSSIRRLLAVLPSAPVVTVETASALIGRSQANTGRAINRLVESGVLTQRNIGKQRYRIFEAAEVLNLVTELDQTLTNPPYTPRLLRE